MKPSPFTLRLLQRLAVWLGFHTNILNIPGERRSMALTILFPVDHAEFVAILKRGINSFTTEARKRRPKTH
jgi:hypothetical protein